MTEKAIEIQLILKRLLVNGDDNYHNSFFFYIKLKEKMYYEERKSRKMTIMTVQNIIMRFSV